MSNTCKPYIVRQGEDLLRIAFERGLDPNEIWDHPKNAELRKQRSSVNILAPGDILFLPDAPPPLLPVRAGSRNIYSATVPLRPIVLTFHNDARTPLADEPYEINGITSQFHSKPQQNGKTDASGKIRVQVPILAREFSVIFPRLNNAILIRVSHMDPGTELSGVAKRLANLGYIPQGTASEEMVLRGLDAFRAKEKLASTDEARKRLFECHGS